MNGYIVLEILVILLLIMVNGFFALSEIAIVSARKPRLKQFADAGNKKAEVALKLAEKPEDLLSTVQIGITLVGILTGVFGGATLAADLAIVLESIGILAQYSELLGLVIVVSIITYLSLVIGELVPKSLALQNAERVAMAVATFMYRLSRIVYPFVRLLTFSTRFTLRLVGVKQSVEAPVTDEEITIMMDEGAQAGVFEPEESDMVGRILSLNDQTVDSLMIPRPEIVWLDIADTFESVHEKIAEHGYSRFPVVQDDLDHVIGFVEVKDFLMERSFQSDANLANFLTPPMYVPESMSVLELLQQFKEKHKHMSLVFDEYGTLQGLVTSNDLLEAIVGDIDLPRTLLVVQRPDNSWLVEGMYPIVDLLELLGIDSLPIKGRYKTMGGFMMSILEKVPKEGEYFDWQHFRFEVIDMDNWRVDKVLISSLEKSGIGSVAKD